MKKAIRVFLMTVGVLTVLFVILFAITADQRKEAYSSATSHSKPETYTTASQAEVLSLVNQKRGEAGVEPLIVSNELQVSAQWKADDMANRMYFSHEDQVTGKDNGLDKIIELTGSFCHNVSENLFSGMKSAITAQAAIDSWMKSDSHREALLNAKYTYTGIGISTDKNGRVYQVEHFCQKA